MKLYFGTVVYQEAMVFLRREKDFVDHHQLLTPGAFYVLHYKCINYHFPRLTY